MKHSLSPPPSSGLGLSESTRTELFSDGVFAIVITLLVIEIHRPKFEQGELASALLHGWPSYLAYCLAFLYVGVIWLNHAALFQRIQYVDLRFKWVNLGIMGTTALIPFPMGVLADAFQSGNTMDQKAAVVLYAFVAGLMSAAWLPVFPYLHRHPNLLASGTPSVHYRHQLTRPIIGVILYAFAAMAGWWHPLVGITIFVVMIVYHAATSEGLKRRATPSPDPLHR